jgi:alpha-tubulin suppressor-like RCC1 family protein
MSAKRHSRPDRPLDGGAPDRRGRRRAVGVLSAFTMAITLGLVGVLPNAQVANASHTLDLVSVVPARLLETRVGPTLKTIDGLFQGVGKRAAGAIVELKVAGRGGVPVDADAVFLNLTAVGPDGFGFLTAYPCGASRPLTSNVNYAPGDVVPNAVLAKIGVGGKVCIYTKAASDIIADVNGYVPVGGSPNTAVPARILETRVGPTLRTIDRSFEGIGKQSAGAIVELKVAGRGGVPVDADAVFLNLTAVGPDGFGFLTAYPCGASRPLTSNVNYGPGDVSPNAVLAKIGAGGKVCIYTKAASDIIADVNGFVPAGGTPGTVVPSRILETRVGPTLKTIDGLFQGIGKQSAGGIVELKVAGRGGVPGDAEAAFLNVTAINPEGFGYVTVYPCGEPRPLTSNINYTPGDVAPNSVFAKIGAGGKVCIYTLAAADLIVDVSGHVPEAAVKGLVEVSFGSNHGCGLDDDGGVTCWGFHENGEIGVGDTSVFGATASNLPVRIPNLTGVTDIEASERFTCAVLKDAKAACWGLNSAGQLGDGTTQNRLVPTTVQGVGNAVQVTAGWKHACALLSDGTVKCWGFNTSGQLGDGTKTQRLTPVTVAGLPGGKTVSSIDAGFAYTCALFTDGTASCWGANGNGVLGDGTAVSRPTPAPVAGLTNAVEISAGQNLTCARLGDGTVRCWGAKGTLLGNGGPTGAQTTPVAVAGLSGVASIDVGSSYSCVSLTNGGAKCWGFGANGKLGTGSIADSPTPAAVKGYEGSIVSIDAADGTSGNSTCAVLDDMTAVCWGYNFNKELGALTPGADPRATSFTPLVVGS